MNWRWVSLAAALAAIVIGYGAFVDNGEAPVANHEMPDQPGYYLKDAVILRTREDGSPGIELIARRIEQRLSQPARGEAITMESVRVNYFGTKDWQWELTAKKGLVPPNSRVVQLEGDVELRPLEGNSNMYLRTNELAIDTEKNIAYSTRSPVQMRYGQHSMTVKSLRADLTSEKLRLETVNGKFDPQTRR
ncbi:LPS export ABC transporter periplasmic protein LptC [Peristeroidobacter soli]|jgi:LPS export ABC transporter protein LptC|uniref:LPS export ABC transporter periplasmic protein LptC n=1 Tax=Peristeroidobacter soli TaxID=2497877 RepID=UPI00101B6CA6|nr:LPS export ABC transporter periplasmic protein LptC [Peristeroidobacter soli]